MSEIFDLSRTLGERLLARGWLLATAESCTGGGIAAAVTDVAGSSAWFDRGFVTYSNAAKQAMLGVPAATLEAHGAVSEATARAMAAGALARSAARIAVAVTGVAGPSGGSPAKPVGTVWFGYALADGAVHARLHRYDGDRAAVRMCTVARALADLIRLADGLDPA
ncbi:MAG: CinA family protein [Gammaproteobacteria bacterium]